MLSALPALSLLSALPAFSSFTGKRIAAASEMTTVNIIIRVPEEMLLITGA